MVVALCRGDYLQGQTCPTPAAAQANIRLQRRHGSASGATVPRNGNARRKDENDGHVDKSKQANKLTTPSKKKGGCSGSVPTQVLEQLTPAKAAITRQISLDEPAAIPIAGYDKKKAIEDFCSKSYEDQKRWFKKETDFTQQYQAVMEAGSKAVATPALQQRSVSKDSTQAPSYAAAPLTIAAPAPVVYSAPERGDSSFNFPLLTKDADRTPTSRNSLKESKYRLCRAPPLFASSVNTAGETCLETTFEGWKFAGDTQYYFHNGTHGVLQINISAPTDDKENSPHTKKRVSFCSDADISLMPGEAFQGKDRYCNFVVTTPDGKKIDAEGKIGQQTEARYRYFYYVNAQNELKVVKGEMVEGAAWSRWRPLELM